MKTSAQAIDELIKALNAGGYGAAPPPIGDDWSIETQPDIDATQFNKKDERYPHKCPRCKGPAYIGFSSVDCKAKC
jgi:hypothetical protein